MVFGMVILLVLGLAAVLLELYFLPGIRTGFPGIFEKIGVYPGLILLPMVLSNSPRYCDRVESCLGWKRKVGMEMETWDGNGKSFARMESLRMLFSSS